MHLLYRIAALFAFVASLLGCNQSQRSFTERSTSAGIDQLYSKVTLSAQGAEFHCIASDSGRCHYTLFAETCASHGPCPQTPLRILSVSVGDTQHMSNVPEATQICVRRSAVPVNARCQPV